MTKHTPGPWRVSAGHAFGSRSLHGPGRAHVAEIWNGSTGDDAVAEENARVVVNALDMLAELKRAETVLVTAFGEPKGRLHSLENGKAADTICSIRAVIAKAEGRI